VIVSSTQIIDRITLKKYPPVKVSMNITVGGREKSEQGKRVDFFSDCSFPLTIDDY
jgi:hypothetical protein